MISVTVVIPTHSRLPELRALLSDLSQQAEPHVPFDVVVVDSDAGLDSTAVVQHAADRGLPVRRILTPNNVSTKRNVGAGATDAELLIFLDDDLRVGPHFVAAHVEAHSDVDSAVVSGAVTFPPEWIRESNYYRFKAARHRASGPALDDGVAPHHLVSMNFSITAEVYRAVGGFDPSFAHYGGEDLDFGFRCKKAGFCLAYAPKAAVEHWEVRMNPSAYFYKVYRAAYNGMPLLVAKHPEAREIRTVRLSMPGAATGIHRIVQMALFALARPGLIRRACQVLDRFDGNARLRMPVAYKVLTILANCLGTRDALVGSGERLPTWATL